MCVRVYAWAGCVTFIFVIKKTQNTTSPSKMTILGFQSKKMRNVLKYMKKQFSDFCNF